MVAASLVPRPRGREKWPGIHCLRMRERFRNLLRTGPIMDKLHVVVMRRNNQTRYTASSVAALFTQRWLPLSETQGVTQGLRYNHRQYHCHCACSWNKRQSRSRWTSQVPWVATGISLYHRGYIWSHPAALLSTWNLPFQYNKEQTWTLYQSPHLLPAVRGITLRISLCTDCLMRKKLRVYPIFRF